MIQVPAQKFLAAWRNATSSCSEELSSAWFEYELYTSLVLKHPNCILERVARELGLSAYLSNYYSVDGLLYSQEDLVPGTPKKQTWFRSLSVAFEHENDFRSVYQEIAHLLILRAQLSVVVTYSPKFDEKRMNYLRSIIDPCPHASELDAHESFLMILGRRDPLDWDGYVFKRGGWKRVAIEEPNEAMQATCEDARA